MKKQIILIMLSLTIAVPVAVRAQSIPTLTEIDFSEAKITQSGPESFYLRNVKLPDQTVSLTISLNDEGYWKIGQIIPDSNNAIPIEAVLDFATIEAVDDDSVEIDWIIYKGEVLSGVLSLADDGISVSKMFSQRGSFSDQALDFPKALGDLLEGRDANVLKDKMAEVRAEYEAKITALKSQYDSVVTERNDLNTRTGVLKTEIDSLESDNVSLAAKNSTLQMQIDTLKTDNNTLENEFDKLKDELSSLREEAATLRAVPEDTLIIPEKLAQSYLDKLEALQLDITLLKNHILELESALDKYAALGDEKLANLEQSIDRVETDKAGAAEIEQRDQTKTDINLKEQIEQLFLKNAELRSKIMQIGDDVRSTLIADGFIAAMKPFMTWTLNSGFDTSEAQLGLWQVEPNYAAQLDSEMLFGKLMLPLNQESSPVLYSFKARSTDPPDDWVGFGLHVYVEGVEKRGYGLGKSLLVWLTRDREVYKSDYTYLQLYRSDDDVHMERVMDAVIPDPITEYIQVEVLYEPVNQYITIAVDGEEKIRYKTWFGIKEGVEMALRSLGKAEFTDLEITTLP